jgi:hypothetical protein
MKGENMKALLLLILLWTSVCEANDWNLDDTMREVVWQTVNVIDWGQTLEIARNPEDYREYNPVLGKHPSVENVNLYMLSGAIGHSIVSYVLPKKARMYWQYITIGLSGACVINNASMGIRIKF